MNIGDRVQTINTLCPISGTIVDIYNNLIVISDDDDNLFIFDRDMTPNEITLNVKWRD